MKHVIKITYDYIASASGFNVLIILDVLELSYTCYEEAFL